VAGTRWWNVRHPAAYAERLGCAVSPGQAREVLTSAEQATERIMLGARLASGCPVSDLSASGRVAAATAVADGLATQEGLDDGFVRLTRRGRLLADGVIRDITG
jgi:oxygen-independent coproporphyrinogen-3 oxidase